MAFRNISLDRWWGVLLFGLALLVGGIGVLVGLPAGPRLSWQDGRRLRSRDPRDVRDPRGVREEFRLFLALRRPRLARPTRWRIAGRLAGGPNPRNRVRHRSREAPGARLTDYAVGRAPVPGRTVPRAAQRLAGPGRPVGRGRPPRSPVR